VHDFEVTTAIFIAIITGRQGIAIPSNNAGLISKITEEVVTENAKNCRRHPTVV